MQADSLPSEPPGKPGYLFAQAFRSFAWGGPSPVHHREPLPVPAPSQTLAIALCSVVCFPVSQVYQPPPPMKTLTSCPSVLDLLSLLCLLINSL